MIRRTLAALALCLAACGGSADTPIYRACTSDGDCVAGARCVAAWSPSTPKVCASTCATDADCPRGGTALAVPYCGLRDHLCYLGCRSAGACTADLTCRVAPGDGYAYCY